MENKQLTLNEYQKAAMTTCMSSCENFSYMVLNLMGELGEFTSKIGKLIRKGKAHIENNKLVVHDDVECVVLRQSAQNSVTVFGS